MGLIGWLDRVAGRFNRKFDSTAVAAATENSAAGTTATANAVGVKAGLGEIEKEAAEETTPEE